MFRRVVSVAGLAVGLAVAPAQAGPTHHNPVGMPDATGDAGGAPDIARVTVANDLGGRILFVVQVSNRSELVPNDVVLIRIDSDRSAQTGEPDRGAGVDYMIELDATARAVALFRWNGTGFERAQATVEGAFDAGYVVLVDRSVLGNPTAIDFYVVTVLKGTDPVRADTAPDAATYPYALSVSHVESMTPRWAPAAPRAGATFRLRALRVTLQTGDTVAAARISCYATLAGKRLRGTGRGRCTFRLPRTARGHRLVVAVTAAAAGGEAETGWQTFRVR